MFGFKDGKVVPSEAAIVRRIFRLRAQGFGYFKICRQLERDGVLTPRGRKTWEQSSIASLVRNERYIGTVK